MSDIELSESDLDTGEREAADYETPYILVIEARFYEDITDELVKGAIAVLVDAGATYERVTVPGALEIPAAIRYPIRAKDFAPEMRRYDGYVVLGCVIRGETSHFDVVCRECARGVMQLAEEYTLALGFGVLTVDTREQAIARAAVDRGNQGARAARACLRMIDLKRKFRLFPR